MPLRHLRYAPTNPRPVLIAALILFTTVLTVAPRANSRGEVANAISPLTRPLESLHSEVSAHPDPRVAVTPLSPPLTTAIGSVLITVRQNGFEPSEIMRAAGRVFLVVQNRSGFQNVQLRLDRNGGGLLYDVAIPRSKLDWVQVVDLQPGGYGLTDAYHPDWACKIEVIN